MDLIDKLLEKNPTGTAKIKEHEFFKGSDCGGYLLFLPSLSIGQLDIRVPLQTLPIFLIYFCFFVIVTFFLLIMLLLFS